jgi:tagaturonate reductase
MNFCNRVNCTWDKKEEVYMQRLSMDALKRGLTVPEDVTVGSLESMPERVIQFGEGNFLRAFVDWMINKLNGQGLFKGKVVIVQPIEQGLVDVLNEQDGLYTLYLRGLQKCKKVESKEIITSVSRGINPYKDYDEFLKCAHNPDLRYMVSNTTEAGIAYLKEPMPQGKCPTSFPAKVTAFLYERYQHFDGDTSKGMMILPCELINNNGTKLNEIIQQYIEDWNLGDGFRKWLADSCKFYNTLVDRIVTGYPREEIDDITKYLGYEDKLVDTGEIFHLWVIEGDQSLKEELPFHKVGLNVIWTDNQQPYRERKVRILNGAHTMTVPAAYLYGFDTVRECVEDPVTGGFMKKGIFEEVIPVVDLPEEEKKEFAEDVLERFANPFIRHMLLSITLNSVSKFKVRVLPSMLDYYKQKDEIPSALSFSLAALIAFYRGTRMEDGKLIGQRDMENSESNTYHIQDDLPVLEFFAQAWKEYDASQNTAELVRKVLSNQDFWEMDLTSIPGLEKLVVDYLNSIINSGIRKAIQEV